MRRHVGSNTKDDSHVEPGIALILQPIEDQCGMKRFSDAEILGAWCEEDIALEREIPFCLPFNPLVCSGLHPGP